MSDMHYEDVASELQEAVHLGPEVVAQTANFWRAYRQGPCRTRNQEKLVRGSDEYS